MSEYNYREMYVSEALEHVETMNSELLLLEQEPQVREHVDRIFRSAHTIKGMAATMGYDQTRELCKNIENIFDKIRKEESNLTQNLASSLFKCIDLLQHLISDENKKVDLKPYLYMLENPDNPQKVEHRQFIMTSKSPTIRVKMSDLDALVNLVGEIVISKMRIEKTLTKQGSDDIPKFMMELGRLVTDLQYQSMKLRLVPLDQIFSRFNRLVRDVSKSLGKKVELQLEGSTTELDRTVIDAITDPLLHILRNCVDHGIESPAKREAIGKPTTGTIKVKAYSVGDRIAIKIEDDGKGIDLDKIKSMALEKGILTEEDAMKMSEQEIINLLGTPGLSTASEVTDISGRGVGMDAVISEVEEVGGNVKITTNKGRGTTIILNIPLKVSIIGGLLVNVSNQKYVFPLSSITTTIEVPYKDIKSIHGVDVVQLREEIIPILWLADVLGINSQKVNIDEEKILTVVIVNKDGKPCGLVVDSFDRKQDIVIKRLDDTTNSTDLFMNATILPDGRVALILDPALLV